MKALFRKVFKNFKVFQSCRTNMRCISFGVERKNVGRVNGQRTMTQTTSKLVCESGLLFRIASFLEIAYAVTFPSG